MASRSPRTPSSRRVAATSPMNSSTPRRRQTTRRPKNFQRWVKQCPLLSGRLAMACLINSSALVRVQSIESLADRGLWLMKINRRIGADTNQLGSCRAHYTSPCVNIYAQHAISDSFWPGTDLCVVPAFQLHIARPIPLWIRFDKTQSRVHLCPPIPALDPWRWGGHRRNRVDGVGRCDCAVLQPLGQDPDAAALPARLQAGAIEGTRYWSL